MPFDFIPPVRLVDKTIGSVPITPGSTAARLFDQTIGAPSVTSLFGLSIVGIPSNVTVGDATVFAPLVAGGTAPYTLSVSSGSLPPGRSISGLSVGGSYTTAGSYSYTLRATDSLGATADLPVSLTVVSASAATAPAAPTLTLTPGNGQVSITWTDGSTGGAAITAHKLYRGASAGSLALVGTISSASPYVDTALANGTAYFYALSAVNSVGEGSQSAVQSATPAAAGTSTRFDSTSARFDRTTLTFDKAA